MQLLILLTLVLSAQAALPCASNQFTDSKGICQTCTTNCLTCTKSNFCNTCVSNFYVVSNAQGSLCQPCSIVLNGCITCLSNVACQICAPKFFNKNGACLTCDAIVSNCSSCSSDGVTCNQCKYPFILFENRCVSQTTASIIAGGNNNPVAPPPFNRTETLPNGQTVIAIIDRNGCNQFQTFTNGKCVKTIANCQVYQPSGFCQICNTGFLVTIFGDCVNNNTRLRCENGFWLNRTADICVKASVACDWFYPNNGSCFNCSTNYRFVDGLCLPKVNCTNRQFYSNGVCVDVNRLCATWAI